MGNFMNKLVRDDFIGTDINGDMLFVRTDYRPLVIGVAVTGLAIGGYVLYAVVADVVIPKVKQTIRSRKENEIIDESEEES